MTFAHRIGFREPGASSCSSTLTDGDYMIFGNRSGFREIDASSFSSTFTEEAPFAPIIESLFYFEEKRVSPVLSNRVIALGVVGASVVAGCAAMSLRSSLPLITRLFFAVFGGGATVWTVVTAVRAHRQDKARENSIEDAAKKERALLQQIVRQWPNVDPTPIKLLKSNSRVRSEDLLIQTHCRHLLSDLNYSECDDATLSSADRSSGRLEQALQDVPQIEYLASVYTPQIVLKALSSQEGRVSDACKAYLWKVREDSTFSAQCQDEEEASQVFDLFHPQFLKQIEVLAKKDTEAFLQDFVPLARYYGRRALCHLDSSCKEDVLKCLKKVIRPLLGKEKCNDHPSRSEQLYALLRTWLPAMSFSLGKDIEAPLLWEAFHRNDKLPPLERGPYAQDTLVAFLQLGTSVSLDMRDMLAEQTWPRKFADIVRTLAPRSGMQPYDVIQSIENTSWRHAILGSLYGE